MRTLARFCFIALAALMLTLTSFSSANVFAQTPTQGQVLITEFRLDGPSNVAADEFIEIYNNTDSPITVNSTDTPPSGQVAGWSIGGLTQSGGGSNLVVTIPNGTTIPARGHYLAANSAYSLSGYAARDNAANFLTAINDTAGVGLFTTNVTANYSNATRLDSVAFAGAGTVRSLYVEGTGLTLINTSPGANDQFSHVRKMTSGVPLDTNNNSADFVLVSTTGSVGTTNPTTAVLGAPGPENLSSPIRNTSIASSFVPNVPDRILSTTPVTNGSAGTIRFNRRFTNNTGSPVSRLRFRIIDITTLNSPDVRTANNNTSAQQAILRVLDGANATVTVRGVPLRALTLEQPPTQPNGGGLNSSLVYGTFTVPEAIPVGGTVDVQFQIGVQQGGYYRFFFTVEASLSAAVQTTQQ